jgi:hypothetical protein
LWTTTEFSTFRTGGIHSPGNAGTLLHLGEPRTVSWWAEGRTATRAEILHSVATGYPLLEEMARSQSQEALHELDMMRAIFSKWLPRS